MWALVLEVAYNGVMRSLNTMIPNQAHTKGPQDLPWTRGDSSVNTGHQQISHIAGIGWEG